MVELARRGVPLRRIARRLCVALCTVQRWVGRAGDERLDRADFGDAPAGPKRPPRRVSDEIEALIVALRKELKEQSDLGEYGAAAIRREMLRRRLEDVPCERTIARIVERRGALDGKRRVRRPAPPPGWYLPAVALGKAELDSFDIVEGLAIRGGPRVEVLNGVSLHGGLCGSWPRRQITAKNTVESLLEHWRTFGLPGYAQFDNDTIFQGAHQWPDSFGRVMRLCLSLGVVPVFAPARETGFQAAIENYNGRWQAKVWRRFQHTALKDVIGRSAAFVKALLEKLAVRRESSPRRRAFPSGWELDLQLPLRGRVIFLRRSNGAGEVEVLGRRYAVSAQWPHRLVRAEVDLDRGQIEFWALRRREPESQRLLRRVNYEVPKGRFHE